MVLTKLLTSFAAVGVAVSNPSSCDSSTGSCPASVQLAGEQLLLQTAAKAKESITKDQVVQTSSCGEISRRRRQEQMNTCRRRYSHPGLYDSDQPGDSWGCNEATNQMECKGAASPSTGAIGYPGTGHLHAHGLWCAVNAPPDDWNLKTCPGDGSLSVKVLVYNLFWWNLFGIHHGSDRSAGRLIARTAGPEQYDLMAFQECDDAARVMNDAAVSGLHGNYQIINGPGDRAISLAIRTSRWTVLASSSAFVGEDSVHQYYGKRAVVWARLQHRDGKTVFIINHHGPLRVSEGGGCTGTANALNILKVIADNAHAEDGIILVGDFNAQWFSSRTRQLDSRLNRVFSGSSMGGVDHVYSNCGGTGQILGMGDGYWKSDHDAISAVVKV